MNTKLIKAYVLLESIEDKNVILVEALNLLHSIMSYKEIKAALEMYVQNDGK